MGITGIAVLVHVISRLHAQRLRVAAALIIIGIALHVLVSLPLPVLHHHLDVEQITIGIARPVLVNKIPQPVLHHPVAAGTITIGIRILVNAKQIRAGAVLPRVRGAEQIITGTRQVAPVSCRLTAVQHLLLGVAAIIIGILQVVLVKLIHLVAHLPRAVGHIATMTIIIVPAVQLRRLLQRQLVLHHLVVVDPTSIGIMRLVLAKLTLQRVLHLPTDVEQITIGIQEHAFVSLMPIAIRHHQVVDTITIGILIRVHVKPPQAVRTLLQAVGTITSGIQAVVRVNQARFVTLRVVDAAQAAIGIQFLAHVNQTRLLLVLFLAMAAVQGAIGIRILVPVNLQPTLVILPLLGADTAIHGIQPLAAARPQLLLVRLQQQDAA